MQVELDGATDNSGPEGRSDMEASIKVIAMPGKHVPPGLLDKANNILGAVSHHCPLSLFFHVSGILARSLLFPLPFPSQKTNHSKGPSYKRLDA